MIPQPLAPVFHGKHLSGAPLPGVGGRGRRPFQSADPGGARGVRGRVKKKGCEEIEAYKKGLLVVYGRGLRASSCSLYPQGVLLLLTGIRFSHMWALGSFSALPGARGRSPGELWDPLRGHFGCNFDPLGTLWDQFWGNFLESCMPCGCSERRNVRNFLKICCGNVQS